MVIPSKDESLPLPCYHLASRAPHGTAPLRVLSYPDPVTVICRRSLAGKVGSVQDSKAIFRRTLRIPLASSGTRFAVLRRVLSFSLPFFI